MVEETLTVGDTEVVVRETDDGFVVEEVEEYDREYYGSRVQDRMDSYECEKIISLDPMPFEIMLDGDNDTWLINDAGCLVDLEVAHGGYSDKQDIIDMAENLIEALE